MKEIRRCAAALLALAMLLLSGCGEKGTESEETPLRACVCGTLRTLDPAKVNDAGMESILYLLFDNLLHYSLDEAGELTLTEGLAREYSVADDVGGLTYTFTLRSTARWSDGKRVTAKHFVYAWRRLADPATGSPNAELLSALAGYDEARSTGDMTLLGVSAKNDSTLIVKLREPCDWFLSAVCAGAVTIPLREDLISGNSIGWAIGSNVVTCGPYHVQEWRSGTLLLARSRDYYEGRYAGPAQIVFVCPSEEGEAYRAYQDGSVDYAASLTFAQMQSLRAQQAAELPEGESAPYPYGTALLAETDCVLYNGMSEFFSLPDVREAFDLAIDRAALADAVGSAPASGLVPEGICRNREGMSYRAVGGALCAADSEGYPDRCGAAVGLLAEQGYLSEEDMPLVTCLYVSDERSDVLVGMLCEMWHKALGAPVGAENVTQEEFDARLAAGDYGMALCSHAASRDEAMSFLAPWRAGDARNVVTYHNETYDILLGVSESSSEFSARMAFLHDAESLLLGDTVLSPLCQRLGGYLLSDEYEGILQDAFGHSFFFAVQRTEAGG